jgi:hypothetical protein
VILLSSACLIVCLFVCLFVLFVDLIKKHFNFFLIYVVVIISCREAASLRLFK